MTIQKQVDKAHYEFGKYVDKSRWNSFYHQIDEIIKIEPNSILEIGVGTGITKYILKDTLHYHYESIDIDEELYPDHVGSVLEMPFADKQYDVVGCFQVLEHLPFENFEKALSELFRVANKAVIISLPDSESVTCIHIPKLTRKKLIKKPFTKLKQHVFDGEHYWEINKIGYEIDKILKKINDIAGIHNFILEREYRVFENPYHHFFVLKRDK
ncbi:hypothetical protein FACS1894145_8110 [Bacteroidia bacterium]|nr:hypothetical protein FACS1894145_8110 [Bacteroidia bacterium]